MSGDRVAKAGELKVELWRYSLNSDRMREDKSSFKPLGKVSEKMLKGQAVSHIVGYVLAENNLRNLIGLPKQARYHLGCGEADRL